MHNSIVSKRAEIERIAVLFGPKAKQARTAKHGNLVKTLLTWLKQARFAGINFDGSILREKALEIAGRLGIADLWHKMAGLTVSTRGTASLEKQSECQTIAEIVANLIATGNKDIERTSTSHTILKSWR
ncbi:hypothetical protein HPB51_013060 [Rhipicephalus microplus]|uniref:Uncharacterized protein n=1 Tax=Rhipicephalus microplus TaxID=6941 RepID=A0A9J6F2A7_RHIMP|nr:hypothetical protein HPB51_013060 [Rhipicephalus microplus]